MSPRSGVQFLLKNIRGRTDRGRRLDFFTSGRLPVNSTISARARPHTGRQISTMYIHDRATAAAAVASSIPFAPGPLRARIDPFFPEHISLARARARTHFSHHVLLFSLGPRRRFFLRASPPRVFSRVFSLFFSLLSPYETLPRRVCFPRFSLGAASTVLKFRYQLRARVFMLRVA